LLQMDIAHPRKSNYTSKSPIGAASRARTALPPVCDELTLRNAFVSSTVRAHRLLQYAGKNKPETQFPLELELYKAHHVEGKAPSDSQVLAALATKAGLFTSEAEAIKFVESDEFEQDVRDQAAKARESGIKSVPHYVINGDASPGSKLTDEFIAVSTGPVWYH
jgi:predicted DsbA family dithiol-disulfide isomerase